MVDPIYRTEAFSRFEEFEFEGQKYELYYMKPHNFEKAWKQTFKNSTWLRMKLSRGFMEGKYIYLREPDNWYYGIAHRTLIIHEIGHILGYKHTLKPTIMNPYWIFRWLPMF